MSVIRVQLPYARFKQFSVAPVLLKEPDGTSQVSTIHLSVRGMVDITGKRIDTIPGDGTIPKSSYSNEYIRCRCDYKSVKSVKSVSFNFS